MILSQDSLYLASISGDEAQSQIGHNPWINASTYVLNGRRNLVAQSGVRIVALDIVKHVPSGRNFESVEGEIKVWGDCMEANSSIDCGHPELH